MACASSHQIWFKDLYIQTEVIGNFVEIQDGGRCLLGFLSYVNLAHFCVL